MSHLLEHLHLSNKLLEAFATDNSAGESLSTWLQSRIDELHKEIVDLNTNREPFDFQKQYVKLTAQIDLLRDLQKNLQAIHHEITTQ